MRWPKSRKPTSISMNNEKQLHLTIARMAEAHQEEMTREIGYLQKKLDALKDKVENYTTLIKVHEQLGGKNEGI